MSQSQELSLDDASLAKVLLDSIDKTLGDPGIAKMDDRIEALDLGSLQFIQFVVLLEHRLNVEFADEMLNFRRFVTLQDVLDYVKILRSRK
jgi:acyl carrier protein